VGDRPDRRHQQLRPRHPRLGTAVAAVVDGEPVAAATVAPALGDVYTADTDGAYRNGESMCVSDVSNPRRATVDPTLWWDFDSRDEYAAACEAIVRRFSDLRRFGAAQIVLPTVAAGGLEGTISNLRANPWDSVAGVFMVRQAGESDGYRGEPLATRLNRARRLERESPRRSARRGARDRGTRLRGRLHCEESEATLTQTAACARAPHREGAVVEDGRADEQRGADEQDEADLVEHGHREPRCRFAERDGDARDEQHDPEVDGHIVLVHICSRPGADPGTERAPQQQRSDDPQIDYAGTPVSERPDAPESSPVNRLVPTAAASEVPIT